MVIRSNRPDGPRGSTGAAATGATPAPAARATETRNTPAPSSSFDTERPVDGQQQTGAASLALGPPTTTEDVRALQAQLASHGVSLSASGAFDGSTVAALREFQRARGLEPTGVLGLSTLRALETASVEPSQGVQTALARSLEHEARAAGWRLTAKPAASSVAIGGQASAVLAGE